MMREDDTVFCADGGYLWSQKAGLVPQVIIGDFDSSEYPSAAECEVLRFPVKKDDTDTMICIKEGLKRGFRQFLLLGMTGGRPDHTFANYTALYYLVKHGAEGTMIGGRWQYNAVSDGTMTLNGRKGCSFAVFPFGCEECCVSLSGFLYEGNNLTLSADFPLGVSNTVADDTAVVRVKGSAILMTSLRNE